MREQVESDLADGDLTHDKNRESSADRVGALAFSSELSRALKHLSVKKSANHLLRAIDALAEALTRGNRYARLHTPADLHGIAKIAVLEWLNTVCGRCDGRRWVMGPPRIDCPKCEATGRHLYTPAERARAFGRKLTAVEAGRVEEAHELIGEHEVLTGSVVRHMVERT